MNKAHFWIYFPKIILEILRDFIYFPLWWYSVGFFRVLEKTRNFLRDRQINLGLLVWVKNLFTPMYGQKDFVGKLISFFIRLFQIIVRAFLMLLWVVVGLVFIVFWLALPIAVVLAIIYQII